MITDNKMRNLDKEIKYLQKIEKQVNNNIYQIDDDISNFILLEILDELSEWQKKATGKQLKKIVKIINSIMDFNAFNRVYRRRILEKQKEIEILKDKDIFYRKEIEKLNEKIRQYELNIKI